MVCLVFDRELVPIEDFACIDKLVAKLLVSPALMMLKPSPIPQETFGADGNAQSREEAARMQRALATNPRIAKRLLILSSLYARTDATSLMRMRAVVDKMAWASQLSPVSAPTACVSTGALSPRAADTQLT